MKTTSLLFIALLCIASTSCKKDNTNGTGSHIKTTVTYTPPASTQYDVYSLDGNITLILTTSQNQVIDSAILTQSGTADFGVKPSGSYTITATATEQDVNPTYGITSYRTRQGTCSVTTPGVSSCSISLD